MGAATSETASEPTTDRHRTWEAGEAIDVQVGRTPTGWQAPAALGRERPIPCHNSDQPLAVTLVSVRHGSLRSRRIPCHLPRSATHSRAANSRPARASQHSACAPAGFEPGCERGAGALGSEHDGSRPAPPGQHPGRRSARRHGPPPVWRPPGSGPSSRPPRHPAAAGPWQRVGRQARRPERPVAGWSLRPWAGQARRQGGGRGRRGGDGRGRWR
jgi:hypothetical protein